MKEEKGLDLNTYDPTNIATRLPNRSERNAIKQTPRTLPTQYEALNIPSKLPWGWLNSASTVSDFLRTWWFSKKVANRFARLSAVERCLWDSHRNPGHTRSSKAQRGVYSEFVNHDHSTNALVYCSMVLSQQGHCDLSGHLLERPSFFLRSTNGICR